MGWLFLSVMVVAILFALFWWRGERPIRTVEPHDITPPAIASPNRPQPPLVVHENGYVGSASCQACHAEQFTSWHASYHRTMTQAATAESVLGNFNDLTLDRFGAKFQFSRGVGRFWVEMPAPEWGGPREEWPRIKEPVVLVTGSHHMQVYWYASGPKRLLGQVPWTWLIDEKRWLPRDAAFLKPPHEEIGVETGRWNYSCVACHTTGAAPRFTLTLREKKDAILKRGADTHVGEFGISCEACHGPAERHVVWHRDTPSQKRASLAKLAVPSKLPSPQSSQVCGQCHAATAFRSLDKEIDWWRHGSPFRPGDDLDGLDRRILRVHSGDAEIDRLLPEHRPQGLFWPDGMVRVSGQEYNGLIESPCFKQAVDQKRLSCMSCHSMHPRDTESPALANWAMYMLESKMRTDQACTQCHVMYASEAKVTAHTHHAAGSSGSACYNCHMPYTSYGLLRAIRAHQITSPSVQPSLSVGRPNACNQCHLDKTLAWTADHLHTWYGIERPKLEGDTENLAASVLWALSGDAGQRALMAWSFGWGEARAASGTEWMTPLLLQLADDDYEAVRIMATRSLKKQAGFEQWKYDPVGPLPERAAMLQPFVENIVAGHATAHQKARPQVLQNPDGRLNLEEFRRRLKERNTRVIELFE